MNSIGGPPLDAEPYASRAEMQERLASLLAPLRPAEQRADRAGDVERALDQRLDAIGDRHVDAARARHLGQRRAR